MTTTRDAALARQLMEAREAANYTQEELGKLLGLDRSAISKIEAGKRSPRAPMIRRWMAVCGLVLDFVDPGGPDRAAILGEALAALSEDERDDVLQIMRAWPRLSEGRRQRILGLAEAPEG
jgi:transcriptional regulator with XRE-family HTH domain